MTVITVVLLLLGPVSILLISWLSIRKASLLGSFVLFGLKNYWTGVAASTWVSAGMSARD